MLSAFKRTKKSMYNITFIYTYIKEKNHKKEPINYPEN